MSHEHGHHHHAHEAHGGAAVLDIGGEVGALNVVLDEQWAGRELYLRNDDPHFSVHTGVWIRHQGGGHVTTALFLSLVEGTYWVLDAAGRDVREVTVRGGELTELICAEQAPRRGRWASRRLAVTSDEPGAARDSDGELGRRGEQLVCEPSSRRQPVVWTMRTLQGAARATSMATEPRIRDMP